MNAEEALRLLRGRNRYIRQLPSGLWARIVLPQVRDLIATGRMSLPVVAEIQRLSSSRQVQNGEITGDVDEQAIARVTEYQVTLVTAAIKGLAEREQDPALLEDVEYPPAVIAELDQLDFDQVFRWADRIDAIDPKASPLEPSPDLPDPSQVSP